MTTVMAALMCVPFRRGPRTRPPTGGDNEAIKAKELEARRQVALVVSPVEATTSAAGSLSSCGNHLSTDNSRQQPPPHRWLTGDGGRLTVHKEVLAPALLRSEDKTIQERGRHLHGVRRLV
jgi:hypothetical protein